MHTGREDGQYWSGDGEQGGTLGQDQLGRTLHKCSAITTFLHYSYHADGVGILMNYF